MADNYLEWRMEDLHKRKAETEEQIRRRVRMRRELERIAAERRAAKASDEQNSSE